MPAQPLTFTRVARYLEETLFPTACVLCGARAERTPNLCCGCRGDLPRIDTSCILCAEPLPAQGVCARCQRAPPPVDRTLSAYLYTGYVPHLIHQLKFSGSQPVARLIGELLCEFVVDKLEARPDAILPVPLHPKRLRSRGFNQALEISRAVHKKLRVPLIKRGITRIGTTAPQSQQRSAAERQHNVRGVFKLGPKFGCYEHVAIVDDVMSSGATVFSLATALRHARAVERIEVWTFARAHSASRS